MTSLLAQVGGLLFLLTFVHFVVDWGLQTDSEASNKALKWKVRARHCTVYTVGVTLCLWATHPPWSTLFWSACTLWVSHFLIDTYLPVYLWVKYLRKPAELTRGGYAMLRDSPGTLILAQDELHRFKAFANTPLGILLVVAVDQAWHTCFLIPVACLLVLPEHTRTILWITGGGLVGLGVLVGFGYRRIRQGI